MLNCQYGTLGNAAKLRSRFVLFISGFLVQASLWAAPLDITLNVVGSDGVAVTDYRWLVEEDTTFPVSPGTPDSNSLAYNFHRSYMPVVKAGTAAAGNANTTITLPDDTKRYYISVLPASGYTLSGKPLDAGKGQTSVTVTVNPQPVPTAQISIFAFEDNYPINNAPDLPQEPGLGGFTVQIFDLAGQVTYDAFGNPLGTTYTTDTSGNFVPDVMGNGTITTMSAADLNDPAKNPYGLKLGEARVKYLAPGKYGVKVVPAPAQGWQQTSTIEGTPTVDAWVKPNETPFLVEFGPTITHAFFGFIRPFNAIPAPGTSQASSSIGGRIVNIHPQRPPMISEYAGHPLPNCWIGMNEAGQLGRGIFAQPCNADSTFTVPNVPPGTYQLVVWDTYMDVIFGFFTVVVPNGGGPIALGDLPVFRWFAAHDHYVFYDANGDGKRDVGEAGIPDQVVNLRFRDGSIYQSFPTDTIGFVPFDEIFPFFDWLIAEVDFTRYKATGVTVTVDAGGPVNTADSNPPGWGKLTPQIQADGQLTRTQTEPAPVLLQAFQSFQGTTHVFEWGKQTYSVGENGGISGIVHYATTRAENDPRYGAAENWEPGIPRVQVNLYQDNGDGKTVKDVNGNGTIDLADVDNYPFGWADGSAPKGPEDAKRNNLGTPDTFNAGDAVQIVTTDSWDDNLPTECPGDPADPFYQNGKCYDGLRNYNQVRQGVFDGGYAFVSYFPGGKSSGSAEISSLPVGSYIVEGVTPPGYGQVKEEDKNVDFGDEYAPSPLLLPPVCVGDMREVPQYLALFPGVQTYLYDTQPFPQSRPLCDRKQVLLSNGKNAAVDFYMFTEVPAAAHVKGLVTSDVNNEFNPLSPNFGEKFSPAWIPISFRDYTGREVNRVYTDEHGAYNALLPSTYSMNLPMPSGVSSNMMQVCINSPGPIEDPANPGAQIIDPYFNRKFMSLCLTFNFQPGQTTYLDTPVLPVSAFAGSGNAQLDCDYANGTPVINYVTSEGNLVGGGPYVSNDPAATRTLTITSMGTMQVPDPFATGVGAGTAALVSRDHGFGGVPGIVTIGSVALTGVTWSNDVIVGTVPAGAATGQLVMTRGDNGKSIQAGVTVTVGGAPVVQVAAGESIQSRIDTASDGTLILVPPGTYREMLIMHKPVKLQGWGPGSTVINASRSLNAAGFLAWREKVNVLVNGPNPSSELLPGQANNEISPITGQRSAGTGLLATEEGAGVLVWPRQGEFSAAANARIDGFTITGADSSAGIMVNGYASYLEISNNQVTVNSGAYGAGIRVGHPFLRDAAGNPVSGANDHLNIHHNKVTHNGAISAPGGGIAIYNGSDDYLVSRNFVCGNFSQGDGAGIAHFGRSQRGRIVNNAILYNQGFEQTPARGGDGGGILVSGIPQSVGAAVAQSEGSGNVTIDGNKIHGNHAGSGDGGGISLRLVNGQDVLASPTASASWYSVNVFNNLIVNNVAGLAGGGIAIQDAARVNLINNTIAHNDSTATAGAAFTVGNFNLSTPQPAGVVSRKHSDALLAVMGAGSGTVFSPYSNPVMANNIVFNNRSMHWSVDLVSGQGEILYDNVNDLAVIGISANLNPLSCLLTDNNAGYDSSNLLVASATPIFVQPYFNARPGTNVQPDGTLLPLDIASVPQAASAFDEGGNFLEVQYGPLSLYTTPLVDYHILPGSPAVDYGTGVFLAQFAELRTDYDGQVRPGSTTVAVVSAASVGNGDFVDIGADEVPRDTDTDGIPDYRDNCTQIANPNQRDTNGDGYGNLCDADFNNTGTTNTLDLNLLKAAYGSVTGGANYNPDIDLNGDGRINTLDLNMFKGLYGKAPGPSCCGL